MKAIFLTVFLLIAQSAFASKKCQLEVKAFSPGFIYSLGQLQTSELNRFQNKKQVKLKAWEDCYLEANRWALILAKAGELDYQDFIDGIFLYYGIEWKFGKKLGQINQYTAEYYARDYLQEGEFLFDVFGQRMDLELENAQRVGNN